MKASELRIGNWVNHQEHKCVRVTDIDSKNIGYDWHDGDRSGWYDIDDFKPIQLTEEWLVKFGFKEVKRYTHDYEEKIYSKSIIVGSENHCETLTISMLFKDGFIGDYFSDECYTLNIDINNVHQLQNIYFALTNEEL